VVEPERVGSASLIRFFLTPLSRRLESQCRARILSSIIKFDIISGLSKERSSSRREKRAIIATRSLQQQCLATRPEEMRSLCHSPA
jgi:hypothetical protein